MSNLNFRSRHYVIRLPWVSSGVYLNDTRYKITWHDSYLEEDTIASWKVEAHGETITCGEIQRQAHRPYIDMARKALRAIFSDAGKEPNEHTFNCHDAENDAAVVIEVKEEV